MLLFSLREIKYKAMGGRTKGLAQSIGSNDSCAQVELIIILYSKDMEKY
jgi:hypothetical protein